MINTIDRFALQYRLPDGKTVVDRFVASRPDLVVSPGTAHRDQPLPAPVHRTRSCSMS